MTVYTKPVKPFLLGVAGGSGSGKTYFARDIQKYLGEDAVLIYQDNYYIDQSKRFDYDGGSVNFDHPSSIDFPLLAKHLQQLKSGQAVHIPIYDFVTHSRREQTILIEPKPVIIIDGILIFHAEEVRPFFDDLVFFDTEESLRFQRRLKRDVEERGREVNGVKNQFIKQVKPMHDQFVEPSRRFANTIVKDVENYSEVFDSYVEKLNAICLRYKQ